MRPRVAHVSDLHLGFAAYTRLGARGVNQRALDVMRTFDALIDRLIDVAPDAIVIAGDVFHECRPSNNAILAAFAGFSRLAQRMPYMPIVIAAGNHDLSKATKDASILRLLEPLGVHVADFESQRFYFPVLGLSVLAVPDAPGVARPLLEPDREKSYNVLCLHGGVQGAKQTGSQWEQNPVTMDELKPEAWDYCAFGHYHQYEEIAPNAYYSGSIDYTSSNIWAEKEPKGFILRDLSTGAHEFITLAPSRTVLDLPPIDVTGMTPEAANALIADVVNAQPIDDAIVRCRVVGGTRAIRKDVDHKALRAWKRRALAFTFDLTVEPVVGPLSRALHDSEIKRETIEQLVGRKLGEYRISDGVDRGEFETEAQRYLGLAKEKMGEAIAAEPVSIEAVPSKRKAS